MFLTTDRGVETGFQSTPPHGERRYTWHTWDAPFLVSIHAPARGATKGLASGATPRGFQSTPPHGERLKRPECHLYPPSFNPRPRTGSDRMLLPSTSFQPGFQSTPPHGERRVSDYFEKIEKRVSIHAPARGATTLDNWLKCQYLNSSFNPRPRTGSDKLLAEVVL